MALSAAVESVCRHSDSHDEGAWLAEFHRRDIYANQQVEVVHPVTGKRLAAGCNRGVIYSGALRVEIDGAERFIEVGELSLREGCIA